MTLRRAAFGRMTLTKAFRRVTFNKMTLRRVTFSKMTLRRAAFGRMALGKSFKSDIQLNENRK